MMRAVDLVRKAAPQCKINYLQAFDAGGALLEQHGIVTPLRLAHFLAQGLHETGGGAVLFENLTYTTPARLLEIFGVGKHSAAITAEEAQTLVRKPEALAERVYGLGNPKKAKELGNTRPGDGYRYRGGGLLQTTGGANYKSMGEKAGVDFYGDPTLVIAAEHALKPALQEWSAGALNGLADRDDLRGITRRVNGGVNGLSSRRAWLAAFKGHLGI